MSQRQKAPRKAPKEKNGGGEKGAKELTNAEKEVEKRKKEEEDQRKREAFQELASGKRKRRTRHPISESNWDELDEEADEARKQVPLLEPVPEIEDDEEDEETLNAPPRPIATSTPNPPIPVVQLSDDEIDDLEPPPPRRARIPNAPNGPRRHPVNRTLSIGGTSEDSGNVLGDIEENNDIALETNDAGQVFTLRKMHLAVEQRNEDGILSVIHSKLLQLKIPLKLGEINLVGNLRPMAIKEPQTWVHDFRVPNIGETIVLAQLNQKPSYRMCDLDAQKFGILTKKLTYSELFMSEVTLVAAKRFSLILNDEEMATMELGLDCFEYSVNNQLFPITRKTILKDGAVKADAVKNGSDDELLTVRVVIDI